MSRRADLVAKWEVELADKKHLIEFEHGTLTGKRVIWLDGKEIYRKDLLFELVGSIAFKMLDKKMTISIIAEALNYKYTLKVNNYEFEEFTKHQKKVMKLWNVCHNDRNHRIVLEKDSLDVWIDGSKVQTEGEFDEDGSKINFNIEDSPAYFKAINSGNKKDGIVHNLYFHGEHVPAN